MLGPVALALLVAGLVGCEPDPTVSTLERPADPVVVSGADLPRLQGIAPGRLVAFRVTASGWDQVPVQVDERLDTTMAAVYNLPANTFGSSLAIPVTVYADPSTFVGADPDPGLDADDEIAFMARDAGGAAAAGTAPPAGTVGGGVQVRVTDPLQAGSAGYVYLYQSDGSLDPGAGAHYVGYAFSLASGDYRTTYRRTAGPNPEDSTVTGGSYTMHFADRWLIDRLTLTHGDRPGVDLADRMKYRVVPGQCVRSEDTFDAGEGAFIVNKVGPVRALRSYVGANSGPNTQATHAFYDARIDSTIDLRVHSLPGVAAYLDLGRQAFGMSFRNPQLPGGVTVDGTPDAVPASTPTWWTFTGPQGVLGSGLTVDTDTGAPSATWYEDDLTPSTTQCTGDAEAVGEAGARFGDGSLACTDPGLLASNPDCGHHFRSRQSLVAAPAGVDPAIIQRWSEQARTPLATSLTAFG
ncbi:MAG TPA: hypothetical protein VF743_11250 [Acidimicrobiales bacterium]